MIKSMTGFGKAVQEAGKKKITAEIRTLNSKQMDITIRLPGPYKEKELDVRSGLSKRLERGKVDCTIHIESNGTESTHTINTELALGYLNQLKNLAGEINEEGNTRYLELLLKMPEVMRSEKTADEEEWGLIESSIYQAAEKVEAYRATEGQVLATDLAGRIATIKALLDEIEKKEPERIENIRQRMMKSLEQLKDEVDESRLEQEILYYQEKIDFTEEKVRLTTHCNFFLETMEQGKAQGKKLGFIAQEIGREINTLGSKANHADIQKLVVEMKDELEKIKEQVLNVL